MFWNNPIGYTSLQCEQHIWFSSLGTENTCHFRNLYILVGLITFFVPGGGHGKWLHSLFGGMAAPMKCCQYYNEAPVDVRYEENCHIKKGIACCCYCICNLAYVTMKLNLPFLSLASGRYSLNYSYRDTEIDYMWDENPVFVTLGSRQRQR